MKQRKSNRFPRLVGGTGLLWAGYLLLATPQPCLAAAPAPLPVSGQTACFDQAGNQLQSCSGTGQDGDTLAGVAWPASRFQVNSDSTVTDAMTGLAWTLDANAPGPAACDPGITKTWPQALSYVKCLNDNSYLGKNDWRLPNIKELWSLFNGGQGTMATWLANNHFDNVQIGRYKSSTASTGNLSGTPLVMDFGDGTTQGYYYNGADHVWPVRTAQPAGLVQLPQTGATLCYDVTSSTFSSACAGTGQDAELRMGVPWSTASRFTVATDTIDDTLTGLQWVRHGRSLSFAGCSGGALQWGPALLFVQCLNDNKYLNKNDWRLPNVNELSSLSNAGSDIYAWLTTAPVGFDLDQNLSYWTSSSYVQEPFNAWSVLLGQNGALAKLRKTDFGQVLPVRTSAAVDTLAPVTTAAPAAGTYATAQTVTLSANEPGSTIHFTTDGTAPTLFSNVYTAPLTVSATATVRFFAVDATGNQETVKSALYTISAGAGYKRGDVNRDGVVDLKDALLVYQAYLASGSTVDPLADVAPLGSNGQPVGDGKLDLGDVIIMLRYVVGAAQW